MSRRHDANEVVEALIASGGRLYSEEAQTGLDKNTPMPLFHWLLTALLLSARISGGNALDAARGLKAEHLHTVSSLLASGRQKRIRTLNKHGYARYDTKTAEYLLEAARRADELYGGDLRRLRDGAEDAEGIVAALKGFKGIGDVGASIFCREAQLVWDMLYPRLDGPARAEAEALGLPTDPEALVRLAGSRERFVRLAAALTRAKLEGLPEPVRAAIS